MGGDAVLKRAARERLVEKVTSEEELEMDSQGCLEEADPQQKEERVQRPWAKEQQGAAL